MKVLKVNRDMKSDKVKRNVFINKVDKYTRGVNECKKECGRRRDKKR